MQENRLRILYISYWGIKDVLFESSVIPSLKSLSNLSNVEEIIVCTIERDDSWLEETHLMLSKCRHVPMFSRFRFNRLIAKIHDFLVFPLTIFRLTANERINQLICRSSLAGALALPVVKLRHIPIIIESFEPHADYMIDSFIWNRWSIATQFFKVIENNLKRCATYLLPVTHNYKEKLIEEGIAESKIKVMPCTVDTEEFSFNLETRKTVRHHWQWDEFLVGIYVGKFGGIYFDKEALELFRKAFDFFRNEFALIVLTPQIERREEIMAYFLSVPPDRIKVFCSPHHEVAGYLSVADFAFSTIKPTPSRRYCSPIKTGEYWANGLPILTEDCIGDDTSIILSEGGGAILKRPHYSEAFQQIRSMVLPENSRIDSHVSQLAKKYRGRDIIENCYSEILA